MGLEMEAAVRVAVMAVVTVVAARAAVTVRA